MHPDEVLKIVKLEKYNAQWPMQFRAEANKIQSILKENALKIHHIGSTAIPNIHAKPIIDILPVVSKIPLYF